MFGIGERQKLVPVNNDERVQAARQQTRIARAAVDAAEEEEQRLRQILEPPSDSATSGLPREITQEDIAEASRKLIPRRLGVTSPFFADTREVT